MFHHVHGPMWDQLFGARLAGFGRTLEARIGPRLIRGTDLVTPCVATRDVLVGDFGLRPDRVTVVANGTDEFWSPGTAAKAPVPTIVGCGRLAARSSASTSCWSKCSGHDNSCPICN